MSKFLDENGLSRFWSNLKSKLVGKKITGETYTYTLDGSSVEATAGEGAEIFNYYDTSGENRNLAIGDYSHAEGLRNLASGSNSHAEGNLCIASGDNSHAEGKNCKASGNYSHAEGSGTKASGNYSHAEGSSTAIGNYSHAEGGGTTASANTSHAEGSTTRATGNASHAEGNITRATGSTSHAEGNNTTASGNNSHAEGSGTLASSASQHVQGKYNIEDINGKYAFIIGNGTTNNARSNAFAVDWNGLIYQNNSTTGVDLNNKVDKVAGKSLSTNDYTTEEKTKLAGIPANASDVGQVYPNSTRGEIFNNYQNSTRPNVASGEYSHAEGGNNTSSGAYSHTEGAGNTASGNFSHAEGGNNTANNGYSHAEGYGTIASGGYSHAEGNDTIASGVRSHSEGNCTIAASDSQHVQGMYNVEDANGKFAFIIGNGTEQGFRSNAFAVDWNGLIYQNNSATGVDLNKGVQATARLVNAGAKNLQDIRNMNVEIQGVSLVVKDGVVSASGTATGSPIIVNIKSVLLPPGDYVFSGCPATGSDTTYSLVLFSSTNGTNYTPYDNKVDYGNGVSFTLSEQLYIRLAIKFENGYVASNLVFKPMICTAEDYAISPEFVPYTPTMREMYENKSDMSAVGLRLVASSILRSNTSYKYQMNKNNFDKNEVGTYIISIMTWSTTPKYSLYAVSYTENSLSYTSIVKIAGDDMTVTVEDGVISVSGLSSSGGKISIHALQ